MGYSILALSCLCQISLNETSSAPLSRPVQFPIFQKVFGLEMRQLRRNLCFSCLSGNIMMLSEGRSGVDPLFSLFEGKHQYCLRPEIALRYP